MSGSRSRSTVKDPVCGMEGRPHATQHRATHADTTRYFLLRDVPGKMPLDGEVLEGRSNIDESMVTGEPLAVRKAAAMSLSSVSVIANALRLRVVTLKTG